MMFNTQPIRKHAISKFKEIRRSGIKYTENNKNNDNSTNSHTNGVFTLALYFLTCIRSFEEICGEYIATDNDSPFKIKRTRPTRYFKNRSTKIIQSLRRL